MATHAYAGILECFVNKVLPLLWNFWLRHYREQVHGFCAVCENNHL